MKRTLAVVATIITVWLVGGLLAAGVLAGVPRSGPDAAGGESNAQAFAEYTVGVFLLESGSTEAAIPHLETAWEKSGHDETMGAKLAEAYFGAGDLSRCETVVDEILSTNENHAASLLLKAKVAYLRSRKEEAVQYLERIEAAGEPSFEIQRILASIYSELGMSEKAAAAYERALEIDPSHPMIQYRYGMMLRDLGRVEDAERAFRSALHTNPGFADAALQLAAILKERGLPSEAQSVLSDALEADPSNYEVVDAMAEMYIEKGELEQAIRILEVQRRASALPDDGLIMLGRLYYEVEDYDEALGVFETLYGSATPTADLARILGEISAKAGKKEKAVDYYREAVRLDPGDYRNHLALFIGSSATFTPKESERLDLSPEEAGHALDEAARSLPSGDVDALYLVGISYQSVDSLATARGYLARAAEIRPDDDRVVLNLASVLEKMGRYEDAERYLVVLHDRQSNDPTICNFYGYLLALMGKDLDKAEALVRTALEAEPENGYYIDSLGWVFFKRGEYEQAVQELERATGLVSEDPTILEHLGDAYSAAGRHAEAAAAYERSMSINTDGGTQELARKLDEARKRAGD